MNVANVEFKDIIAPIEKILEFDFDAMHFRMMVTDNILIKCYQEDGSQIWETNNYKDQCKIICQVGCDNRVLRLESKLFLKSEALKEWDKQKAKFILAAIENKDKFSSYSIAPIKIEIE